MPRAHRGLLTHAIADVTASSTIAGRGFPPMMTKCVRTAPIMVTTMADAPKNASDGTRSNRAETTSIVPVAYRNHWPRPIAAKTCTMGAAPAICAVQSKAVGQRAVCDVSVVIRILICSSDRRCRHELYAHKKSAGAISDAPDFAQEGCQLARLVLGQSSEQLPLGSFLKPEPCLARFAAGGCRHGEPRSPVARIRCARHEAIGLQAIDELRDVRLHARQAIDELRDVRL